jgi:hypothetical protein
MQYFVLHVEHPNETTGVLTLFVTSIALAQDVKEIYDWWKK